MRIRSVLFVCTGNICRSPTADGVLRSMARAAGIEAELRIESAGTHDYHAGHPPDPRAQHHAARRGYDLSMLRARQIEARDFETFDLILAMDRGHLRLLRAQCPAHLHGKLRLFMEFAQGSRTKDVPDPYHGAADSFEAVLDLVEDGNRGLLRELQAPP